jgi:hypothetical protein
VRGRSALSGRRVRQVELPLDRTGCRVLASSLSGVGGGGEEDEEGRGEGGVGGQRGEEEEEGGKEGWKGQG